MQFKQIAKKIEGISREIDIFTLTNENEEVLITTKIEKIKATLMTS